MNIDEAMTELAVLGTEQNRKIYQRHGVRDDLFGVSFAHLKTLKKRIRTDQTLSERLWASGNHDARILATMVADPKAIARETLDAWADDLNCYPLSDALAGVAAASPFDLDLVEAWTHSDNEWVASTGWATLSHRVTKGEKVPDDLLQAWLAAIEATIASSQNRVRHAMNNALIAIGVSSITMEPLAIAAAKRIGKVEVDHGETGCKTPDAVTYIKKTIEHRQARSRC